MNEDELRALVRHAIARHTVQGPAPEAGNRAEGPAQPRHASHALYHLINPTEACVIEPAVLCTHCGYCKSHGH